MNKESLEQAFGVPFRSAKDNWKAPCPFHHEKTPSFFVHKEEYVAHCFGCGISGPIDRLLAAERGITEDQARVLLNIEAGHGLRSKIRRTRCGVCAPEIVRFPESWLAPFKKEAHKYVVQRGFKVRTLMDAGSRYDPALQRQVFPHRDRDGRLLGLAGRSCKEPAEYPKWLFYWEYSKGRALYRMWPPEGQSSVQASVSNEPLLVVEGIFDTLWLYQHGVTNVAAILGSKPSRWQIQELRAHGGPYILGLDNDDAGREGTERLYRALKRTGQVYFTQWPEKANDWMDLDENELLSCVSTPATAVGLSIQKAARPRSSDTGTKEK